MFYAYKDNDLICGSDKKETVIKICKNLKITDYELTDHEKIVSKEKTIEELKAEKLSELDQKSSAFEQTENKEMYVTSSLGFKVNADHKALRNIDVLISQNVTQFKVYDNTIKPVTVEDLKIIKLEIEQNALNIYHQKWEYQDMINNASSIKELKKIDIDFKMLDFSDGSL